MVRENPRLYRKGKITKWVRPIDVGVLSEDGCKDLACLVVVLSTGRGRHESRGLSGIPASLCKARVKALSMDVLHPPVFQTPPVLCGDEVTGREEPLEAENGKQCEGDGFLIYQVSHEPTITSGLDDILIRDIYQSWLRDNCMWP